MTTKRGRRSAAEIEAEAARLGLSVVSVSEDRIQAPEHLTEEQRKEWDAIVNSLPVDYFRPGDVSLLAAYCVAAALYKEAALMLQLEGLTLEFEGRGGTVRQYAHPAAHILSMQASAMAQMAQKLRLCPSARMGVGKTGAKTVSARARAGKPKPWEEGDDGLGDDRDECAA